MVERPKNGPNMGCFYYFDFEMCFAPQRQTHFRHLNFQKWSGASVFCTFWLGNALRATTVGTFLTSQLPKVVVRTHQFLTLLTSTWASCHNRMHFLNISTSKSAPNMWCFAHFDFQMCFAPHFFSISTSKNAPGLRCFVHFDFDMCFAPQPRVIFHLSSPQMAPHPPL